MSTKFVNQVNFDIFPQGTVETTSEPRDDIGPRSLQINNLITVSEQQQILSALETSNWLPVSITGMSGNYTEGDVIGSYRASNYTPTYAAILWKRIQHLFPLVEHFNNSIPTDFDNHPEWKPIGVSPLLRFIKYTDGGCLVPHYDAPYVENDNKRTMKSLVIYLNEDSAMHGGETRYLFDKQSHLPVNERDLSDRLELGREDEVRLSIKPQERTGIVFPHRIWHDSAPVAGTGTKIIIRTDIFYEKG